MAFRYYFNLVKGSLRGLYRKSVKFLLNRSSLVRGFFAKREYAAANSDYCFRVWMKHLKNCLDYNDTIPEVVVEIGSGNSLGVGIASLLSGASRFYGLEQTQYWNISTNIKVFDDLVIRFKQGWLQDADDEHQHLASRLFETEHLNRCLDENRLEAIRSELMDPMNTNNKFIRCVIPWDNNANIPLGSVDLVCSHTVLQHIEDLESTYASMHRWLKKGGCMSHTIDFKSMNTSSLWNGHWTYNKQTWKLVTGGAYLINRAPWSTHHGLLNTYHFNLKFKQLVTSPNRLLRKELAEPYRELSEEDLTTSGVYYFAQTQK